jgi:hypothetical protein
MWSVVARCPTKRLYSLTLVAAWEMRIAAAIQAGRTVANWAVKTIFSTSSEPHLLLLGDIQSATINDLCGSTGPKWGCAYNGNATEHREHGEAEGSTHVSVAVCLVAWLEGTTQGQSLNAVPTRG